MSANEKRKIRPFALRASERAAFSLGPDATARLPVRVEDLDLADVSNGKATRVGLVVERVVVDGVDHLTMSVPAEIFSDITGVRFFMDLSTCHRSFEVHVRAVDRDFEAVACLVALLDLRCVSDGHLLLGRKITGDSNGDGKEG